MSSEELRTDERNTDGAPAAVLHDIGYSRFSGTLRPRWSAVLALAASSFLRALGIRRTAGAKVWPFLLITVTFLPAVVAVGVPFFAPSILIQSPLDVIGYAEMLDATWVFTIAYVATTVPSLLTRDRRERVLTLYFSTSLSPAEYLTGKVLAALGLVAIVSLGPLLVLLIGGILVVDAPLEWAGDHAGDLPRILLAALLVCVFQAAVALGLGALTPRRVFAVGGYVALMLVSGGLAGVLVGVTGQNGFLALSLPTVPVMLGGKVVGLADGAVSVPVGALLAAEVLVVLVGAGVLVARYLRGRDQ